MNSTRKQIISVHQLLHGYDDGHRLIKGSMKPNGKVGKALLAMSDLAGYGEGLGEEGYLTGYPLPEEGAYAIARTWPAPEMSRPGCVWTHTLLIDFSDLAYISDTAFLNLFRRPDSCEGGNNYTQPLTIGLCVNKNPNPPIPNNAVSELIEPTYGSPERPVFVKSYERSSIENIVMTLWLQQWPRLRRSFRFCTWAPSDRSRPGEQFDLQFVPHNRTITSNNREKGKWVDLIDDSNVHEGWVVEVSNDAIKADCNSNFRNFLGQYGAETGAGRAAFKPLSIIWNALGKEGTTDTEAAISAVAKIPSAIKNLSLFIAQKIMGTSSISSKLPVSSIDFLIKSLELGGDKLTDGTIEEAASTIWKHAPERIWPFFSVESSTLNSIANASARLMSPEEALNGSDGKVDLFCAALKANRSLAASHLVWEAPPPLPTKAATILADCNPLDNKTLYAMLDADSLDIPSIGIDLYGSSAIFAAIKYYDSCQKQKQQRARKWLIEAKHDTASLMAGIRQCKIQHTETLTFLSTLVKYDAPSGTSDVDVWAKALISLKGELNKGDLDLCIYLLKRALRGSSEEPGFLIRKVFDTIHSTLVHSQIPYNTWSEIDGDLPQNGWWSQWDKAHRVRRGVVDTFVSRNLPTIDYLLITKDDNVFSTLTDLTTLSETGRKYLEKITINPDISMRKEISRRLEIVENSLLRS